MTRTAAPRRPKRRPPASAPPLALTPSPEPPPAAGGPSTRRDSALGRLLMQLLAYFEARQKHALRRRLGLA